jgi:AcrR family transcriptional regulator
MPTGSGSTYSAGESTLDLRSRRKLRTRRALQQAAVQLFAEQGYEDTTVADIAARAEVSIRTFFLHFPTKEDVLFDGSREAFPDLVRLILAAPAGLSDLAALEAALVELHGSAGADRDMLHQMTRLLVRAAAASSVVRGRRMANADKIAAVVASALAQRRGEDTPSLATVTLAEAAMRMHHLAIDEWAVAPAEEIIPIFRARFQTLRQVMGDRTRIGPRRAKDRRLALQSEVRGAGALFSIDSASPTRPPDIQAG